jgi:hypothetical protein
MCLRIYYNSKFKGGAHAVKFLGHTQFLEVCTASKEIMLFHDNAFVLLRYAYGFKFLVH